MEAASNALSSESWSSAPPDVKTRVAEKVETAADVVRTASRIQELMAQRREILFQVKAQLDEALPDGHSTIARALEDFLNFFSGYTNYFFALTPEQLQESERTYESILNRVLDTTRRIWDELSTAINQRYNPAYRAKLKNADDMAEQLLARADQVVRGMPILYFGKLFQISRHPYQTYPLLALSLDRFNTDGYSSLAHELGHHVFWNNGELEEYAGRLDAIDQKIATIILAKGFPPVDFANPLVTQQAIRSRFEQYNTWVGWIEETFADVFGALIAGPVFAKSAQDILIRERLGRPADLLASDGEHPIPALRPFIAIEVLRCIARQKDDAFGASLDQFAKELEGRWQPLWEEALEQERQLLPAPVALVTLGHSHRPELPAVTLQELRNQLVAMVNLVVNEIPFNPVAGGEPRSLIALLDHWGKQGTADEQASLARLTIELARDGLAPISRRTTRPSAFEPASRPPAEEDLFAKFLAFIQARQAQQSGRVAAEITEVNWEQVIDFELTLNHHIHDYCSCHGGNGPHYHTSSGGTVSC